MLYHTSIASYSFASRVPLPTMAAYSASKAALASFVDSIRPELASSGIHVTQIQPGRVQGFLVTLAPRVIWLLHAMVSCLSDGGR